MLKIWIFCTNWVGEDQAGPDLFSLIFVLTESGRTFDFYIESPGQDSFCSCRIRALKFSDPCRPLYPIIVNFVPCDFSMLLIAFFQDPHWFFDIWKSNLFQTFLFMYINQVLIHWVKNNRKFHVFSFKIQFENVSENRFFFSFIEYILNIINFAYCEFYYDFQYDFRFLLAIFWHLETDFSFKLFTVNYNN